MEKYVFDFEKHMMEINAVRMPDCMGKLRKVASMKGNFELYYNTETKGIEAVAKPGSGCVTTCNGSVVYFRKMVRWGDVKQSELTKFGRRIALV